MQTPPIGALNAKLKQLEKITKNPIKRCSKFAKLKQLNKITRNPPIGAVNLLN